MTHRIVVIVGPTASGKTNLALELAARRNGEIISSDSVQVYRGLDIGSGKPTPAERSLVPHHLVDILDIHEEMNAAMFAQRASHAIADIASRGRLPIVTGGTGLYLTALLKGLFEQPEVDLELRSRLEALAERHGSVRLHRLLAHKDPVYAAKTKPSDRIRVIRALEVCFLLGRPFSRAQEERRPAYLGEALIVGLDPGREVLRTHVAARVGRMIAEGLVEETRRALASVPAGLHPPRSLGAIGYRQVASRLAEGTLQTEGDDELQRVIVTATMQYAKRQMTYFRHQFDVEWFALGEAARERAEGWLDRPDGGGAN